ncbi:hypothetical protein [Alkalibacterium sp. 20]|uniref:hypothetical protein n=1 Tax=Alkalibacterium sp. 20 TaxID=1798803 RepID=UPI000AE519ED|nr:hypothetical protein [Alkalibacterium sp. 20]
MDTLFAWLFIINYFGDDDTKYEALYTMKITDVVRGDEAFTVLQAENEFIEPAPEGME